MFPIAIRHTSFDGFLKDFLKEDLHVFPWASV
jgi:hypothetical protein